MIIVYKKTLSGFWVRRLRRAKIWRWLHYVTNTIKNPVNHLSCNLGSDIFRVGGCFNVLASIVR